MSSEGPEPPKKSAPRHSKVKRDKARKKMIAKYLLDLSSLYLVLQPKLERGCHVWPLRCVDQERSLQEDVSLGAMTEEASRTEGDMNQRGLAREQLVP